jgi:hypothetical protein
MSALKFPGRTCLFLAALFFFPARDQVLLSVALVAKKEEYLSFDMGWNCPSALLVAMNGLNGDAKQICKLLLSPAKFFSRRNKFILIHTVSSFVARIEIIGYGWLIFLNRGCPVID